MCVFFLAVFVFLYPLTEWRMLLLHGPLSPPSIFFVCVHNNNGDKHDIYVGTVWRCVGEGGGVVNPVSYEMWWVGGGVVLAPERNGEWGGGHEGRPTSIVGPLSLYYLLCWNNIMSMAR